jgi:Putative prokaryotic signal transducing protein
LTQIDWGKERRRLADLYAGMEDGELEQIATRPESLTEVAREVLRSEMSRRGMTPPLETSTPDSSNPKRTDAPVMIRRFQDLPEALLSKSILDSAGIESFLADENLIRIDWFYSNLVGGIKLLVRAEDAETASKILAQETPEKFDVDGVGEYKQPRCPRCQSLDVAFDELNKRIAYGGMLFVGFPIAITSDHWKCHSCGNEWEDHAEPSSTQKPKEPQ